MGKSLRYYADNLIVSPKSERRQLHLNHSDTRSIKERGIILAALCDLKEKCEVLRENPKVHVLIFSLEGNATLFIPESPKKGIPIEPGHVVILPAHHQHKYVMDGGQWKAIWFYLADTNSWRHIREIKPHIRISLTHNELRAVMEGLLAESLRNENRAHLAVRHYAELILLNLDRELDMEDTPSHREMKQRLYQLWDTVSANLAHNWTVAEMAEQVGISPQHFYKVSARFSGYKPVKMVTRLRMQQAQEYLISSDYMIKSIAHLLGYSDSFSFSAAFKRDTGYSPKQFREKHYNQYIKKEKEEKEDGWY